MGTAVLESGVPIQAGLHIYTHSLRDPAGGVALLVINTDKTAARALKLPIASERYTLSATSANLQDRRVQLNGEVLQLRPGDTLPPITGHPTPAGEISFPPATITFLAILKVDR